ncbi:MAG: sulfotransferase domain-containing protein [Candidatus Marinimicrobia bacterium]|nr:sulfotransferase domain-containing protein [Candidatus Neomarinimicrobiota bacterium]
MSEHPPSFFLLGTQKGGTSTIHYWLSQNPHLSLPKLKETHYFSHADRYNLGLEWYYHWFTPKGEKFVRGEVDPSYLFFPKTPSRIKQLCSHPKFIIILRDPLKRAYSHYLMSVQRGYESLDFLQALESEETRLQQDKQQFSFEHHSYLSRGNYSEQIMRYKYKFSNSPFLFLRFDDLYSPDSRREMYQNICDFIGVSSKIETIDMDKAIRPASTSRFTFIRDLVYKDIPIRRIGRRLIPFMVFRARILNFLDKLNKKQIGYKMVLDKSSIPSSILRNVNIEIDSVSNLTNLDIGHWRQPAE